MKLPNVTGIVKVVKTFAVAHRPEILLGAALVATVGTGITAAIGGYKARGLVDEANYEASRKGEPNLTPQQIANLTWHCYIPATIAGVTALGSTAGLHFVHVKDKKALVAAGAAALEEMKAEFKQYEKEHTVGVMSKEEKEKVLEARQQNTPIDDEHGREAAHVEDSDGFLEPMYLVRDGKTGRDIWSNEYRIESAINEINGILSRNAPVELNYFYTHAGFGNIDEGDELGWNAGECVNLEWKETVRDDGRPVRRFAFRPKPSLGFDKSHQ